MGRVSDASSPLAPGITTSSPVSCSRTRSTARRTLRIRRTFAAPSARTLTSYGPVSPSGWYVSRPLLRTLSCILIGPSHGTVRRAFQPECPPHSPQPSPGRYDETCDPVRLRLFARVMPELLLRDRGVDCHRCHDRQLCWCASLTSLRLNLTASAG